jgi:transposase
MSLYCGIDLHSTNQVVVILDEQDRPVLERRLPNRLEVVLEELGAYRGDLAGIAVESTYNWYWLVDGLMEANHPVSLVNTSAVKQYEGLKHTDDRHDARWLAHLMRLGILPTGYIYPKQDRPVRDLLRHRIRLVEQRTANLLSVQNVLARETGQMIKGNDLKALSAEGIRERLSSPELCLALDSRVRLIALLGEEIDRLEEAALERGKLRPEYRVLLSAPGIGKTLGLVIMYETGDIRRFPGVGNYASYCRCVRTDRVSNRKKKGEGNRKNGNPHLSWAFGQAAHFARRYQPQARKFYQRKLAQRGPVVANRALAHKLSRAVYFMLRDQTRFDPGRLFQ